VPRKPVGSVLSAALFSSQKNGYTGGFEGSWSPVNLVKLSK